jgi:hypothetical protein
MSVEKKLSSCAPKTYQITVEGAMNASWSDWLAGMDVFSWKEADGVMLTTLSGELMDQAALRGVLNRLWDLNLVVRSVWQVSPAEISD